MDYRKKAFKQKFNNAAHYLGVPANQIISLKYRETVASYSEYRNLLKMLEQEIGISYRQIDDNFQGTGYLLEDSHSKVIVVEHETGLEILYIAGSIASLISLVPLVIQCWNRLSNHFRSRHQHDLGDVEIRKLDDKGNLKEDHIHEPGILGNTFILNSAFISATQNLETEINKLKKDVASLTNRLMKFEKRNNKQNKKKIESKTKKAKK